MPKESANTTFEPFLTIRTRRFSIGGGSQTALEIECPELGYGVGKVVSKREGTRLIEDLMSAVTEEVESLAVIGFIDSGVNLEELKVAKRIHELIKQGVPLAQLFRHP